VVAVRQLVEVFVPSL